MSPYPSRVIGVLAAVAFVVAAAPAQALERREILAATDGVTVMVVTGTLPAAPARVYAVIRDLARHAAFAPKDRIDGWRLTTGETSGVGAWAEYDLHFGATTLHQRVVIADEETDRYLRLRSDRPEQPYDVHWLLDPVGDGGQTRLTIVTRTPQSRNWFDRAWRSWAIEPQWQALYEAIPGRLTAVFTQTP